MPSIKEMRCGSFVRSTFNLLSLAVECAGRGGVETMNNKRKNVIRDWLGELRASVEKVLSLFNQPAEPERWIPELNDPYFIITLDGNTMQLKWRESQFDQLFWEFGNCFKTRQEAEQARDAIQEVLAKLNKNV